jgi:orotidine-5'-phosphate decarboxylase
VAKKAVGEWNGAGNVFLVAGATCPDELAAIRRVAPDMPLLVPGVGAQGADIAATVANGRNARGDGMIINSSRAIIHADSSSAFAAAARDAAATLRDAINRHRRS